jgi:hypothetical protein
MLDTGKELYKIEGGRYTAQGARRKVFDKEIGVVRRTSEKRELKYFPLPAGA